MKNTSCGTSLSGGNNRLLSFLVALASLTPSTRAQPLASLSFPSEEEAASWTLNSTSPTYNTAFLTDVQLEDYDSLNETQIRAFLSTHNSYFRQTVIDVDGVSFDAASVIRSASVQYQINPKVILVTLQKEQTGVTRSTRPSDAHMAFLMGCIEANTARQQLICAAERFRSYHNGLINNGQTVSGWRVGVVKTTLDGVSVTPATRAVAGQFTYTPYVGYQWDGNNREWGGVYLFYYYWNEFGFGSDSETDLQAISAPTGLPVSGAMCSWNGASFGQTIGNGLIRLPRWVCGTGLLKIIRGNLLFEKTFTIDCSPASLRAAKSADSPVVVELESTASCAGTASTRFAIGDLVEVSGTDIGLRARYPNACSDSWSVQRDGSRGTVVGGPVCCDGYHRWQIRYENLPGVDVWSAEGERNTQEFFLRKVSPSAIALTCSVSPSSVSPNFPVTVSGTANYNNSGGTVPVGTATITIAGETYTAAINQGTYSRSIYGPNTAGSYTVSVSAADGLGRNGTTSASLTIESGDSGPDWEIDYFKMCADIDTQGSFPEEYPDDIRDVFSSRDNTAYAYIMFRDIEDEHTISFRWYRPDGSHYGTSNDRFGEDGFIYDDWYVWSSYDIEGFDIADIEGRWKIKLYIDGMYVTTKYFTVRYELKEHRMAQGVQPSEPWDPINPKSVFTQTDERALTWCKLDQVADQLTVKWVFFEPNGSQYSETTYTGDSVATGDWLEWEKVWGWIDVRGNSAANKCGDWRVDMYLRDAFGNWDKEYTDYFKILESPGQPPTCGVSLVQANPLPGQTLTLNVAATDNTYLRDVVLFWRDSSEHSTAWNNLMAGSLAQSFNIGSYSAGQQVEVWAIAKDTSGNSQESSHQTIVIPAPVVRPLINGPQKAGNTRTLSMPSQLGYSYTLEFKNSLSDTSWTSIQTINGTGNQVMLTDPTPASATRFYRVRIE